MMALYNKIGLQKIALAGAFIVVSGGQSFGGGTIIVNLEDLTIVEDFPMNNTTVYVGGTLTNDTNGKIDARSGNNAFYNFDPSSNATLNTPETMIPKPLLNKGIITVGDNSGASTVSLTCGEITNNNGIAISNNGVLNASIQNAIPDDPNTATNPNATVELNGGTINGSINNDGIINMAGKSSVQSIVNGVNQQRAIVNINGVSSVQSLANNTGGTIGVNSNGVLNSDNIINAGNFILNGGTVDKTIDNPDVKIDNLGVMQLNGGSVNQTITNTGTVSVTGTSSVQLLNNNTGGTLTVNSEGVLDSDSSITNNGTANLNGGTVNQTINNTNGTVNVSGTSFVKFLGNNAGGTLKINQGGVLKTDSIVFNGATIDLDGTIDTGVFSSGEIELNAGTINGGITNNGMVNVNGGESTVSTVSNNNNSTLEVKQNGILNVGFVTNPTGSKVIINNLGNLKLKDEGLSYKDTLGEDLEIKAGGQLTVAGSFTVDQPLTQQGSIGVNSGAQLNVTSTVDIAGDLNSQGTTNVTGSIKVKDLNLGGTGTIFFNTKYIP